MGLPDSQRPSRVRWRERSGVLSSTVTVTPLSHMPDFPGKAEGGDREVFGGVSIRGQANPS